MELAEDRVLAALTFSCALGLALTGCRDGGGGNEGGETDTAGGTSGSDAGDTGSDGGADVVPPDGIGQVGVRRLSRYEYDNTVRDMLGDDKRPGSALLPEDFRSPFDNDFGAQEPSGALIAAVEALAKGVADGVMKDATRRDALVGCMPAGPTDQTCLRSFVAGFGRRAFRRPLTDAEVEDFVVLANEFNAADFYEGVEVVLRAMLQDAKFIYRIEDGMSVDGYPGVYKLDGFDIAARLSYMMWGSTPGNSLLDHAAAGDLDAPEGVRAVAEAMFQDSRARDQVNRFHAMWLAFDQLPHDPALTQAMLTETRALIERVVFDDQAPWLELFTSTETYLDDTLAAHYGLPLPGSTDPVWVDYGSSGRQGLLSHGSFLSVAGNVADTSPTKRGKLIRERLMCQHIPPPPPDVDADVPPPQDAGDCKWDRYVEHRQNGNCAGCHDQLDPIGFGLENYDLAGRYRAHDDGAPECSIAGDGQLIGVGPFNGPAELADLLVDNDLLDRCVVEQYYRYSMGHQIGDDDQPYAEGLVTSFKDGGYAFDGLVLDFVSNEAFGFRKEEE